MKGPSIKINILTTQNCIVNTISIVQCQTARIVQKSTYVSPTSKAFQFPFLLPPGLKKVPILAQCNKAPTLARSQYSRFKISVS